MKDYVEFKRTRRQPYATKGFWQGQVSPATRAIIITRGSNVEVKINDNFYR